MSLFDVPHPAKLQMPDAEAKPVPVLWFGTEVVSEHGSDRVRAIIVHVSGSVGTCELSFLRADVRYVTDMGVYPALGKTGPGWVDLEDMVAAPTTTSLEGLKQEAVAALTGRSDAPAEPPGDAPAPLVGADGTRYDPLTNLPMDD